MITLSVLGGGPSLGEIEITAKEKINMECSLKFVSTERIYVLKAAQRALIFLIVHRRQHLLCAN